MAEWYVKDLSKLTGVSVQTLHHYDRIGLLKPSARRPNGYRVYSEKDLLRLQQIIALKFFGFALSQIKALLTDNAKAVEHFSVQAQLLEQKARTLLEASEALKRIMTDVASDKSIPWETIIQLIEVYRMTAALDQAWVKDILTPDELKQYVAFEKALQPEQQAAFEQPWDQLVNEIKNHLATDPCSKTGIQLGKKWMDWVNGVYGKKYAHLRTKLFEQGFEAGKGLDEVGLTPEIVSWIDKATNAYWQDRIYGILDQVGQRSADLILKLWDELLEEMYGEDKARQKAIYDKVLTDPKVSQAAKVWLNCLR